MAESGDVAAIAAALEARSRLRSLAARGDLAALIGDLYEAGWLGALRSGASRSGLAALRPIPLDRVDLVVEALQAAGVAEVDGDVVRLAPGWAALVDGPSGVELPVVLADIDARSSALRGVLEPETATAPPMVLAEDWGLRAGPAVLPIYNAAFSAVPGLRPVLEQGGPFLDVGSGIGGALISILLLFPTLSATGIERSPEVAEELTARVRTAGVESRARVEVVDARAFDERECYTCCYWAQEFFAPSARPEVLDMISRALRPGGLLVLQELLPPADEATAPDRAVDVLFGATVGLSFGRTAEELRAEAEHAGFTHRATAATPVGRMVVVER